MVIQNHRNNRWSVPESIIYRCIPKTFARTLRQVDSDQRFNRMLLTNQIQTLPTNGRTKPAIWKQHLLFPAQLQKHQPPSDAKPWPESR